jgi:hypothetical protein
MGVIQFDIRHATGQRESTVIEAERAIIGSAAHCDVRLPMDQAAFEHIVVEVVGGTLRAEAKADQPPATINGMPLTSSPLEVDSALGVGRTRLFVKYVPEVDGSSEASSAKKKGSNPAVQVVLLVVLGALAYLLLQDTKSTIAPQPTKAPKLFADKAPSCPKKDPRQAAAFAQDQMLVAHGKRERMPFVMTDGVAAVDMYQVAAACFRLGGREAEAENAKNTAEGLKAYIVNDFRARRLRLDHMLKVEDFEIAAQDVDVLRSLTRGKKGRYVQWLAAVDKQLEPKRKKKKR